MDKIIGYSWHNGSAAKGTCDTYAEAKEELNKHIAFDLETEGEYKSESSWGFEEITYFYPYDTNDETIQNDDGAYTPQIKEINEEGYSGWWVGVQWKKIIYTNTI
jgi:hypothetical protein